MPTADPFDTVVHALHAHARDRADELAFSFEGVPLTFGQLFDRVIWLARRFRRAGLEHGARCVVMLPSGLEFINVVYASQALGAVPVGVDPSLPAAGRHVRVTTAQPHLVVTTDALVDETARAHPGVIVVSPAGAQGLPDAPLSLRLPSPDDAAYFQFTSGSSGTPRVLALT